MQCGYGDELFQAWRHTHSQTATKIRRKDLPEKVMAMTLDLCERCGERSKSGVGVSTLHSGSK